VLNHLRSSFKHYTSKNRNKDIGWYFCMYTFRRHAILHLKSYHYFFCKIYNDDFVRGFKRSNSNFSCDNRKIK
jgi:hypothetical protein